MFAVGPSYLPFSTDDDVKKRFHFKVFLFSFFFLPFLSNRGCNIALQANTLLLRHFRARLPPATLRQGSSGASSLPSRQ